VKTKPKSLLKINQPELCPGWALTEPSQTDRFHQKALSNQCDGLCCIDRLSWQLESGDVLQLETDGEIIILRPVRPNVVLKKELGVWCFKDRMLAISAFLT
jgi:hypothetical protein